MGLWLKSNGVLVPVGGSGGSDGGPHVLTGDPENPPPELELDQLLYDGVANGAVDASVLNDLDDVQITNPQPDDVLVYDDGAGLWVNQPIVTQMIQRGRNVITFTGGVGTPITFRQPFSGTPALTMSIVGSGQIWSVVSTGDSTTGFTPLALRVDTGLGDANRTVSWIAVGNPLDPAHANIGARPPA
jgi:hypothetical protein